MTTLYRYNAADQLQLWGIKHTGLSTITIVWGLEGGTLQKQKEIVETNKSGRDLDEQIQHRISSRINKQLDKGYKLTREAAWNERGTNANFLLRPMLAKVYDVNMLSKLRLSEIFWQYKYNGHRCLIHNNSEQLIAYSRNGKPITTIDHILRGIDIPEGCTLDGELYIHKTDLQVISSLVKRKQDETKRLKFVAYDTISDKPFGDRLNQLEKYNLGKNVVIAPTTLGITHDYLEQDAINNVKKVLNYEGFMLRLNNAGYAPGKRHAQLLKVKARYDCEGTVVDITPSKDGWAVLTLALPSGVTFSVSAPGSLEDRYRVYQQRQSYLGSKVTVEFSEWTADKKPFHPVAMCFREDI